MLLIDFHHGIRFDRHNQGIMWIDPRLITAWVNFAFLVFFCCTFEFFWCPNSATKMLMDKKWRNCMVKLTSSPQHITHKFFRLLLKISVWGGQLIEISVIYLWLPNMLAAYTTNGGISCIKQTHQTLGKTKQNQWLWKGIHIIIYSHAILYTPSVLECIYT